MNKPIPMCERDLLKRLGEGDVAAFKEIFLVHYQRLCGFAERFLHNRSEAEDAVAAVFLKLWESPRKFHDMEHLKAFFYHAVRNASLNAVKLKNRAAERDGVFAGAQEQIEITTYLAEISRAEAIAELHRTIASLPAQAGRIIKLTYIEGKSNEQTAAELGLTVQTVKNQKRRGLNLLRLRLRGGAYLLLVTGAFMNMPGRLL